MRKAYVSRNYKSVKSAGGKAKTDIESIIQTIGFENIGLKQSRNSSKILDFARNLLGILIVTIKMPKNGIVFLQYPMKKYYSYLCKLAHFKNSKIITLIHDLGAFRRRKIVPEQEIKLLNQSDIIIATNTTMADWLTAHNCESIIISMEIWDYLSNVIKRDLAFKAPKDRYIVNYAGSLAKRKNEFLFKLDPYVNTFSFHLFGEGFIYTPNNPLFLYKGFIESNEFIKTINGDFGLVWDGDSLETCSGNFGVYLKYNTPHKISLYIRSHLPIIIWKDAALAKFVEKEDIGFTITSLKELDEKLKNLPIERYNIMKKNTVALSRNINEGYFIKSAIKKALYHL